MADPPAAPAAIDLHADRGSNVVAASIVLLILPTVAVALRFLSRRQARAGFWWDDYSILLALIFSWGPNISNLLATSVGLGKHLAAIDRPVYDVLERWFQYLYAFEFLYVFAMAFVKFSIIFFMYRIFPIVHFRRVLWACHAFVVALLTVFLLVSIFQCIPIHAFWKTLGGRLSDFLGGRCVNIMRYFLASGAINAATDFVLLALPIPLLWRLRTSKLQKIVLTVIFIIGLTVCAVSITRLIVLSNLNEDDLTWNYVDAAIWTAAEPSIAVVSACIPSLRPLFARMIWGRPYRPRHESHPHTRSFSSSWLGSSKDRRESTGRNGSFNRLRESDAGGKPWVHNVAVTGGQLEDKSREEYNIGGSDTARESQHEVPLTGIRVRTTVTITERVDWLDDLF